MMVYDNSDGGEYGKYFVTSLMKEPPMDDEFRALYKTFAKRIRWIDSEVAPGAFQMNTAWYFAAAPRDPMFNTHEHDYDELVGFFGSDPDNPDDLGGVIEFSLNGEAHRLTKSTMIFCPSGMPHNPMRILEVNRPIFHFSVVMNPDYDGGATYR
jgi:hypothetical protein